MQPKLIITGIVIILTLLCTHSSYSQKSAPVDPVDKGSWILNAGAGPATPTFFYNGYGFGPGIKIFCENGTFQLGPGVLTLGGELGLSFSLIVTIPGTTNHG